MTKLNLHYIIQEYIIIQSRQSDKCAEQFSTWIDMVRQIKAAQQVINIASLRYAKKSLDSGRWYPAHCPGDQGAERTALVPNIDDIFRKNPQ